MRLHKEGTATILLAIAFACLSGYAAFRWLPPWAAVFGGVAGLCVLAIVLWFFRVPRRSFVQDAAAIVSPCDGKVVAIEEVLEQEHFKAPRRQVSIFMSPVNVHVNWYPVPGQVTCVRYHPGKYLVAWHPKSSEENERSTVVIKGRGGEVLVRQIAGALARRIVTYSKEGASVEQGQELGFIKFGSRVDLFLPMDARIEVVLGQRVTGGITIIGRTSPAA